MYRLWKHVNNKWVQVKTGLTVETVTKNITPGHYAIDCTWGSGADYFTVK